MLRDIAPIAEHRRLMTARTRRFAGCWLATMLVWSGVLLLQERIGIGTATTIVAWQAALLVAAVYLCERDPAGPHVASTLLVVSGLLGTSSTLLFALAHASGDALAFVMLTLYLASALFFAWGWRPQAILWLVTVLAWSAAVPFLVFRLPALELAAAIVIGSVLALAIAEGAARGFRLAWAHRAAESRTRAALESARDAAEAATLAKDQFLATVSHELRTPLTAILAWTQLLRRGSLAAEKASHALEVIERNARQQARVVEDLLDLSRIAHGKLSMTPTRLDLSQVVRTVVDTVRSIADAKGVRIRVELPDERIPLRGDPLRLHQVAENLVSNALKFTPAGGRVTVSVRRAGAWGELVVCDTGAGMRPEVVAQVFERFHQADTSTARRHGGLGLGLAIARHLVERHGGTIAAESAGPDRGSTFTVRLPLDAAADAAAAGPAPPADDERTASLAGLRVVVVDDEGDTRDLFATLLSQHGATVTTAASASEAMQRLAAAPADVLVADLAMPGEDGFALIRRVRALDDERGGRLRAIAVTALAGADDQRRALAAGFDLHLAKPVEPDVVVAAVAGVATSATAAGPRACA